MPQPAATAATVGDQASQFSRLPAALLAHILQALPQPERLSSCATVCSSWAAAATAATVDVDLPFAPAKVITAFQSWLQQHARQLVSLTASGQTCGAVRPQLRLPCAELASLSQLELESTALVLDGLGSSNSTAAGAGRMQLRSGPQPQLLPKLRQLKLARCDLLSVEALLQFSVLTSLTSLQLEEVDINSSSSQQAQQGLVLSNALCTLLAQLPQLEDVSLPGVPVAGSSFSSVVQQLSSLRQLRSARINIPQSAAHTDDLLSSLPCGLTGLTVWDDRNSESNHLERCHAATFPQQMPQLSDLQELHLYKAVLHPGMLSVMTRLQRLELETCTLLPRVVFDREDAAGADASASAAASAFLEAVGGLTDLVSLGVSDALDCNEPRGWEAVPPAAFSALTASSKLQKLVVHAKDELPLPWGAVQHAFPAGRVLPHLTNLALEAKSSSGHPVESRGEGIGFMSAQDLRAVVAACPALADLHISSACGFDDLAPLLQLPNSVTCLSLGGSALTNASAATVAQLTQLKWLSWACSPDLTDAGLEHLTALTGLRGLDMTWCDGLSPEISENGVAYGMGSTYSLAIYYQRYYIEDEKEAGTPVWQVLCDLLDKSPQLWGDRLLKVKARWQQQLEQTRAQAQQESAALRQEVAEAQQQTAALRQEVAEARQQSVLLQQQSDQRAAESQQQVTELQQQLAELRQQVAQMQQHADSGGRRRGG